MARPLALGLFLSSFLFSLPLTLKLFTYRCFCVSVDFHSYLYWVFVSTGFGISTIITDITGTARFSLAIFKWLLSFLQVPIKVFVKILISNHLIYLLSTNHNGGWYYDGRPLRKSADQIWTL